MSFIIIKCTEDGLIQSCNDALVEQIGGDHSRLVNRSLVDLLSMENKLLSESSLCQDSLCRQFAKRPLVAQLQLGDELQHRYAWQIDRVSGPQGNGAEYVWIGTRCDAHTDAIADTSGINGETSFPFSRQPGNGEDAIKLNGNNGPHLQLVPDSENSLENHSMATITDHIPAYIYYVDRQLRIRYVNSSVTEIFEQSTDFFIGKLIEEISLEESYESSLPYFQKALAGEVVHFQIEQSYEGRTSYFDITLVPDIQQQDVMGFTILAQNTTEKKNIERELHASEEKFRSLVTATSDHISVVGRDYTYQFMNHAAEGMQVTDMIGQSIFLGMQAEDIERVMAIVDSIFETGIPAQYEVSIEMSDGTRIWYHATGNALYEGEEISGIMFISSDITELKNAGDKATEARQQAEMANRAKTEFLSSMSHELRTPLNSILGFSQVLEANPAEPLTETQAGCINMIKEAGEHLLKLINEILSLARIESGKVEIKPQDMSVRPLLDDCIDSIKPAATILNIQLIESSMTDDLTIRADYARLRQVLLNLLSNAVKYNHQGGKVFLESHVEPTGMLNISVTDTGDGIDEARQHELFQPFSRLGAESTEIEGTGIGLTISKKLVELMEGNIGFTSKVGEGSTFWIELPLATGQSSSAMADRF